MAARRDDAGAGRAQPSRLFISQVFALQRFLCGGGGASTLYGSEIYPDEATPKLRREYEEYVGKIWPGKGAPRAFQDYCGKMPADWACGLYNRWAEKDDAPHISDHAVFVAAFDAAFNQHGLLSRHHELPANDEELDDGMIWVFLPPPTTARMFFQHFALSARARHVPSPTARAGAAAPLRQAAAAPAAARVGAWPAPAPVQDTTPTPSPRHPGWELPVGTKPRARFVDASRSSDEASADATGEPSQKRPHFHHQEEEEEEEPDVARDSHEFDELFQSPTESSTDSELADAELNVLGRGAQAFKDEEEHEKQRILALVAAAPSESEPEDDESAYGASESSGDSDSEVSVRGRGMAPRKKDVERDRRETEAFNRRLARIAAKQQDSSEENYEDEDEDEDDADYGAEI